MTSVPDRAAEAKRALRTRLRAGRRARPVIAEHPGDLAARVLALPEVARAGTVAAYVAAPTEAPTSALVEALHARGVRVLLPAVLPDLDLDWALDDGTRRRGTGPGVLEPAGPRLGPAAIGAADVVLVPALAVDRDGRRLGQGGGSYDRALARAAPGALVVALVHDEEVLDEPVPVAAHDRPVDVVVTAARTLRLSGRARAAAARRSPP